MKTASAILTAFLAVALLGSCDKKDDPAPSPGVGGSMSATIDGNAWAATEANLYEPVGGPVEFYGARSAGSSGSSAIFVHVASFAGLVDYPFSNGQNWASYVKNNVAYVATSGKTTITLDNDTFFKASFVFDGADTIGGGGIKSVSGSFTYRKK